MIDDHIYIEPPSKDSQCWTCALQNGNPPWANHPRKGYCLAYPHEGGIIKPSEVMFDGKRCRFYVRE